MDIGNNSDQPMGLKFDGTRGLGIFVTHVKPESNAEATGQIKEGLRFVTIEGVSVEDKLKEVRNRRRRAAEGKISWKSTAGNEDYAPYPPVIIEEPCHQYRRTFSYL